MDDLQIEAADAAVALLVIASCFSDVGIALMGGWNYCYCY